MIVDADAVVDPLAMMIESLDTLVADVTVTRIGSANNLAMRAEQICFKLLDEPHEWDLWGALHVARLRFDGQGKEDHCTDEDHEEDREPTLGVDV